MIRFVSKQKPGNSRQDYGTPWEFIHAVEKRFGKIKIDLAASGSNRKAYFFLDEGQKSLSLDWWRYECNLWLNPPFGKIAPWAKKCYETMNMSQGKNRIFFLTPASVGANWYWDYIHDKALVLVLHPRLTFEEEKSTFPKDLILSVFGEKPGFERWSWR